MRSEKFIPADIDEYIAAFPTDVQKTLEKIRKTIKKAAPDAVEAISYRIPTFRLGGKNLVHFAAFKSHVSVYQAPRDSEELGEEIAAYKGGKGTVQFPIGSELPLDLIRRIVKYRLGASK